MNMDTKNLEDFICPTCKSDDVTPDEHSLDMIDDQDGYMNVKCNECGSRYVVDIRIVYFPDGVEKL